LRDSAIDVVLLHLEVRNSVSQQPADAVVAFEYGNGVTCSSELLGGS
jgi:hypothetical protein